MLDAIRLRVLVAVAKHGSVTAAAHALNYAQPSISHHMARLEAETGAKLMERAGRGIRLTEAGQLLAERAEEILGRLDAAEAELAAHVGLQPSRVRLAAFGTALATIAAGAATEMRAGQAGSDIQLSQADPAEALRMLRASEADVALTYHYVVQDGELGGRQDDDLHAELVLDEPVYLVCQVKGTAGAGTADVADLAGQRWIAGPEGSAEVTEVLGRSAGFLPEMAIRTWDYATALALVAAGLGSAIMPGLALRAAPRQEVAATELRGLRRQIYAVTYAAPQQSQLTGQFIAALHRAARSAGNGQAASVAALPVQPGTRAPARTRRR